jgi:hypothetical protein
MEIFVYPNPSQPFNWHQKIIEFWYSLKLRREIVFKFTIEYHQVYLVIYNYAAAIGFIKYLCENNYDFVVISYNREPQNISEIFIHHSATNRIYKTQIYNNWCGDEHSGKSRALCYYAVTIRLIEIIFNEPEILTSQFFTDLTENKNCGIFQFEQINYGVLFESIWGHYEEDIEFMEFDQDSPNNHVCNIFQEKIDTVLIYKNQFINYTNIGSSGSMFISNDIDNHFYSGLQFRDKIYQNQQPQRSETLQFFLITNQIELALFDKNSKVLFYQNLVDLEFNFSTNEIYDLINESTLIEITTCIADDTHLTLLSLDKPCEIVKEYRTKIESKGVFITEIIKIDDERVNSQILSTNKISFFELCEAHLKELY